MKTDVPKTRILLVDDHYFVRIGLTTSLAAETDFLLLGHVGNAAEALAVVPELKPDVVVLDGRLPDLHGIELAPRLLKLLPKLGVVMLTIGDSEEEIARAVKNGVHAFVPKSADRSELVAAIRSVARGGRYFPSAILNKLFDQQARPSLSERERQTLLWVAHGLSNKEIGERMGVAEATVKMHVGSILEKLGAADRSHAVTIAHLRGIISLDENREKILDP
jgi:DNA-binding NarL/FixJ family response regulator